MLDWLPTKLVLMPVSLVETILLHPYRVTSQECCGTTAMYPAQDAVRFLLGAVPVHHALPPPGLVNNFP